MIKMGGGQKLVIPDYKTYVANTSKTQQWTETNLAARGLKDPWARNEAWRYHNYPGVGKSAMITVFRGFKLAAAAMIVTVVADKMLGISASKEHHHGDHH